MHHASHSSSSFSVVSEAENYIQFYNYKRRHSGIGYVTQHQKYNELKKWLKIFPVLTDYYNY
jgi:hypothetical protein